MTEYQMTMTDAFASTLADNASVEKMKNDIEFLQNNISSLTKLLNEKKNLIDNARLAILEAFDNESFDRDTLEVVADALNIELTKEYDVTINVTFSGSITVPLGFDVEGNLENYLNFTAEASGWGTDEIDTDLFEDGVDVNVNNR